MLDVETFKDLILFYFFNVIDDKLFPFLVRLEIFFLSFSDVVWQSY